MVAHACWMCFFCQQVNACVFGCVCICVSCSSVCVCVFHFVCVWFCVCMFDCVCVSVSANLVCTSLIQLMTRLEKQSGMPRQSHYTSHYAWNETLTCSTFDTNHFFFCSLFSSLCVDYWMLTDVNVMNVDCMLVFVCHDKKCKVNERVIKIKKLFSWDKFVCCFYQFDHWCPCP